MKDPKLLSLKDFCEKYKLRSYRQMQRYVKDADDNGADMWLHRIGKSIFVNVDKFFEWTKRKI